MPDKMMPEAFLLHQQRKCEHEGQHDWLEDAEAVYDKVRGLVYVTVTCNVCATDETTTLTLELGAN